MADVFNKNPSVYVDMNDLFPVLDDKVGLTDEQWRKAIENANYLYNHLGLADVDIGQINTVFTEPGTLSDVVVSHREVTIDDKTIDYFDFTFYIPSPKIETELIGTTTKNVDEVGMSLNTTPIYGTGENADVIVGYKFTFNAKLLISAVSSVNGKSGDVILNAEDVGAVPQYSSKGTSEYASSLEIKPSFENTSTTRGSGSLDLNFNYQTQAGVEAHKVSIARDGFSFENTETGERLRPTINETEQVAYLSDVEASIQQAILDSWEASY